MAGASDSAVSVAQLVELLVVVQVVAGSSPVAHPKRPANTGFAKTEDRLLGGEGKDRLAAGRHDICDGEAGREHLLGC